MTLPNTKNVKHWREKHNERYLEQNRNHQKTFYEINKERVKANALKRYYFGTEIMSSFTGVLASSVASSVASCTNCIYCRGLNVYNHHTKNCENAHVINAINNINTKIDEFVSNNIPNHINIKIFNETFKV